VKKEISSIIFWGALWGLFEATVGYVLHALEIRIGFLVWFPAAYFFMSQVYKQTGKPHSVFYTSMIAAAIKLIDFLLPVRIDMVLNPFASILLEGLTVFAVYRSLEKQKNSLLRYDWFKALSVSMSWRLLYLLYLLPMPEFIVKISPLSGVGPLLKFLLFEGIMGGAVIYIGIAAAKTMAQHKAAENQEASNVRSFVSSLWNRISLHPLYSAILLVLAVFVQWMI
jgi:hypothetical protein